MNARQATHAAVYGWSGKVVDRGQERISRHTPLSADTVRSLFGLLLLFSSLRRIVRVARAGLRG